MPRIYTLKGAFQSDTTYRFRCEYCGHEYSVTTTHDQALSLSDVNRPPSNDQFMTLAKGKYEQHKKKVRSLWEKGQFAVEGRSAACPDCGFLPTAFIHRGQGISLIAMWLIVGAAVIVPLVFAGMPMPTSVAILLGVFLLIPYLLLTWFLIRRLDPNRKLMRALRDEGRSLASPAKPELVFGPMRRRFTA